MAKLSKITKIIEIRNISPRISINCQFIEFTKTVNWEFRHSETNKGFLIILIKIQKCLKSIPSCESLIFYKPCC